MIICFPKIAFTVCEGKSRNRSRNKSRTKKAGRPVRMLTDHFYNSVRSLYGKAKK